MLNPETATVTKDALDFWRQQFSARLVPVGIPLTRPRPPSSSYLRESVTVEMSTATAVLFAAAAVAKESSLAMLVLAALQTVLFRHTGQERIVVGAFVPEAESLLPVQSHWNSDTGVSLPLLAGQLAAWLRGASKYSSYPLREMQNWAGAEDAVFGVRLFNVSFFWDEGRSTDWPMADPEFGQFVSQCDIVLKASPSDKGLTFRADYDADVLEAGTVARMVNHILMVLEGAAHNPDTAVLHLPLLTPQEREKVLVKFNQTERVFPKVAVLHKLIESQVNRTPDATALIFEGLFLTYRELDRRANQLAHYLIRRGVGPDVLVGICVERSLEMVVGLLGILKAGGAYVPIDPTYPQERVAFMLADAGANVLLTQAGLRDKLPHHNAEAINLDLEWSAIAAESSEPPPNRTSLDNLSYMIYTSGSTGRPKGALNTHRGIVNRLLWMQEEYCLVGGADTVMQKTPFSFDVSVWEFFWPLLAGARLVIARPEGHKDPDYLAGLIKSEGVTCLHFVPSMLRAFLDADGLESCTSLRCVVCSGEALPPDLVALAYSKLGCDLQNLYGPTEAAVDVTYWACPRGQAIDMVPIGRPVANTQCYILDPNLQPVPVGVAGELHLGGVQVGRGYHNQPELTAEKFILDPFSSVADARLYRTGDLCRFLPDGNIEYLGRLDHQVKIRGFRIELGEIEDSLAKLPEIRDVVVVAREDTFGEKCLAAYVTLYPNAAQNENAWRAHLKRTQPDFMIPSDIIVLDEIPLSPNGKVDRSALPKPARSYQGPSEDLLLPTSVLEKCIVNTWCEVLGASQIGRQTNFFDAGGDSLKLIRLRNRLREQWQIDVAIVTLFQHPTIAALADFLEHSAGGENLTNTASVAQDRAQRQREAVRRMQKPTLPRPTL